MVHWQPKYCKTKIYTLLPTLQQLQSDKLFSIFLDYIFAADLAPAGTSEISTSTLQAWGEGGWSNIWLGVCVARFSWSPNSYFNPNIHFSYSLLTKVRDFATYFAGEREEEGEPVRLSLLTLFRPLLSPTWYVHLSIYWNRSRISRASSSRKPRPWTSDDCYVRKKVSSNLDVHPSKCCWF